jgi:hypothetical protein
MATTTPIRVVTHLFGNYWRVDFRKTEEIVDGEFCRTYDSRYLVSEETGCSLYVEDIEKLKKKAKGRKFKTPQPEAQFDSFKDAIEYAYSLSEPKVEDPDEHFFVTPEITPEEPVAEEIIPEVLPVEIEPFELVPMPVVMTDVEAIDDYALEGSMIDDSAFDLVSEEPVEDNEHSGCSLYVEDSDY